MKSRRTLHPTTHEGSGYRLPNATNWPAVHALERYADDIVKWLRESLNGHISTHFLVAKDLAPRVIAEQLRQQRPLPPGRLPELETRVYEQLLDEAVRYTLKVTSLLPRFETAVAAESLKRLSNLGQDVADVLNTVQRLEARVVESTAPGQDARWEADYRAAVRAAVCLQSC